MRGALFALTLLLVACPGSAQEAPAESSTSSTGQAADALLEKVDEGIERLAELRQQADAATGEQKDMLIRRLRTAEMELGGAAHDAAGLILRARAAGEDVGDAEQRVVRLMRDLAIALEDNYEERRRVYQQKIVERAEAGPEQWIAAEQGVIAAGAALDEELGFFTRQVLLMEELGLDATEARKSAIDKLRERADTLAAQLVVAKDELVKVNEFAAANPGDSDTARRKSLLEERVDIAAERLRVHVGELKTLGEDTTDYQKLLVTATGDVGAVGFDLAVIASLLEDWLGAAGDWLADNAAGFLLRGLIIAAILVVTWLFAGLVQRLITGALDARGAQVSQLLRRMLVGLVGNVIKIIGILVALSQLGISIGPMLAGLGIAGFIIGFALQDTLSNFASGVMILFYRPYDVGDFVEAAGISGKVSAMNLVSTTILTFDNQTLIVPNNKIWGDVIRNVTRQTQRRVDLVFGVGYADDMDHVERVLADVVRQDPRVLEFPEPTIKLHELGDSSVNYVVRPWVKTEDYWDVYWDLTREVKRRFDAEGITIPFPQRDLHHYYSEDGKRSEPRRIAGQDNPGADA